MQKNIGLRTQFVRGVAAVVVSLVAACGGSSEPASIAATPLAAKTETGHSDTDTVSVSDGEGGVRLAKASARQCGASYDDAAKDLSLRLRGAVQIAIEERATIND